MVGNASKNENIPEGGHHKIKVNGTADDWQQKDEEEIATKNTKNSQKSLCLHIGEIWSSVTMNKERNLAI